MSVVVDILSVVFEAGSCLCLGSVFGFATAVEYQRSGLVSSRSSFLSRHWVFFRRSLWISWSLGGCLLAWILLEGPTLVFLGLAFFGFAAGNIAGLKNANWSAWPRRWTTVGLYLCGFDYFVTTIGGRLSAPSLYPPLTGLVYTLLAAVVFFFLSGIMKLLKTDSRKWPFHIALVASLLLTSGGPLLWFVLAAAVGFGYSCSSRYLDRLDKHSAGRAIWQGFLALVLAHTLFDAYFYGIASYGIFWNPGVAVAPYALGGMLLGISMHRVSAFAVPTTVQLTPAVGRSHTFSFEEVEEHLSKEHSRADQTRASATPEGGDRSSILVAAKDLPTHEPDPAFHNQLGLTYFALGKYDKAIAEYRRAVELDPCFKDAHYNLAVVYGKGQYQNSGEAIQELHIAISLDPHYRVAPLLLADLYWTEKDYEQAEKWYTKALEIEHADPWELFSLYDLKEVPYRARVHHQLGVVTQCLHRADDALFHFSEALRIHPAYLLPRYGIGTVYMNQRDYNAAIDQFAKVLEIDSGFRGTQFLLGQALFAKKDYAEAIQHFDAELYNNPANTQALFMIGKCHGMRGSWKNAAEAYEKVIQADPNNVEAHAFLGGCYMKTGDFEKGMRYLKKAVAIDPGNTLARTNLIAAYQMLGDNERAAQEMTHLTHIDNLDELLRVAKAAEERRENEERPYGKWEEEKRREFITEHNNAQDIHSPIEVLLNQSRLFYTAGKWEESIKPCEAALRIDPTCVQAYDFIGNALGKLERWGEAEESYNYALDIDPSLTLSRFNRAGIYVQWKQTERALAEYERIIEQDPDFLPAHGNIANLSIQKGDIQRAHRAWKDMLRIDPDNAIARYNLMLYDSYRKE
jgi:tetratricopeptide (TPR) repeat protein